MMRLTAQLRGVTGQTLHPDAEPGRPPPGGLAVEGQEVTRPSAWMITLPFPPSASPRRPGFGARQINGVTCFELSARLRRAMMMLFLSSPVPNRVPNAVPSDGHLC